MSDDGDLPPEARAIALEGIDLDALRREASVSNAAIARHEQIAAVLREHRDGLISTSTARARLHRLDPDHYDPPRG